MNISDWLILAPALCAGLLVLSTHIPLGMEVLKRGIIFIDLAVAQLAGTGVIVAHTFGWGESAPMVQTFALLFAVSGSAALAITERCWPHLQEPIIGVIFVATVSGALLLLASDPHAGEALKTLLAGQILWVTHTQLLWVAGLYGLLLIGWKWLKKTLGLWGFYFIFALSITASVQLAGVYLVFASLIIPALSTHNLAGKARLFYAFILGILGYIAGLWSSMLWDLPTSPLIVWMQITFGMLFLLIRRFGVSPVR